MYYVQPSCPGPYDRGVSYRGRSIVYCQDRGYVVLPERVAFRYMREAKRWIRQQDYSGYAGCGCGCNGRPGGCQSYQGTDEGRLVRGPARTVLWIALALAGLFVAGQGLRDARRQKRRRA